MKQAAVGLFGFLVTILSFLLQQYMADEVALFPQTYQAQMKMFVHF